jgi:hypothetical protein
MGKQACRLLVVFPSLIAKCRVIFDQTDNPFIQARATATNSIVPGAIFKAAARPPLSLQATFSSPNEFLDLTTTLYVCNLFQNCVFRFKLIK